MIKVKYLIGKQLRMWVERFPDALSLYSGDIHEIEQNIESQLRLIVSFPRVIIVRFGEKGMTFKIYVSYYLNGFSGEWESREIHGPDLSYYTCLGLENEKERKEKEWKNLEREYERTRGIQLQNLY